MAGLELISPENLRLDGRKPDELRKILCKVGIYKQADGSGYIEHGNTKVMASVYGPHEMVNKSKAKHDRAVINCQYSTATFSSNERKNRPKGDKRSTERSLTIEKIFGSAILTSLYPRSQIDIFVQVRNQTKPFLLKLPGSEFLYSKTCASITLFFASYFSS